MDSNYQEPLTSLFAVTDDYNFNDPACANSWVCRPNVAPSSLAIYDHDAIPSWKNSLLVVSLKRGRIFRLQLNEDRTAIVGDTTQHFYTTNRYRDIAIYSDGKTFYVLCDESGRTTDLSGLNDTIDYRNPSNILKFTLNETTSTKAAETPAPFSVFPNPTTGSFYIKTEQLENHLHQTNLLNLNGQVVQQFSLKSNNLQALTINDLPAGLYLLQVISDKQSWQQRVVVK
ncbi:MAG: T9SS type A sorting domain-containing protein [Bacteroidota bacterium]